MQLRTAATVPASAAADVVRRTVITAYEGWPCAGGGSTAAHCCLGGQKGAVAPAGVAWNWATVGQLGRSRRRRARKLWQVGE